jgi:hypothetical protein
MNGVDMGLVFIAAGFYLGGVFSTSLVFFMFRDHLIEKAIDARERQIYGPLLERVEANEMAQRIRRFEPANKPKPIPPPPPAATGAEAISLAAFPVQRRRHH